MTYLKELLSGNEGTLQIPIVESRIGVQMDGSKGACCTSCVKVRKDDDAMQIQCAAKYASERCILLNMR